MSHRHVAQGEARAASIGPVGGARRFPAADRRVQPHDGVC